MATTVGTPRDTPSGNLPPMPPGTRSARAELARREDPRKRLLRLVLLLLALLVLVRGWIVTDIDLGKLTNASNAGPILKALLTPDVVARDVEQTELHAVFESGALSTAPSEVTTPSGQKFRITPGGALAGQNVVFEGSGFASEAEGDLRIVFPRGGRDARFTRLVADGRG